MDRGGVWVGHFLNLVSPVLTSFLKFLVLSVLWLSPHLAYFSTLDTICLFVMISNFLRNTGFCKWKVSNRYPCCFKVLELVSACHHVAEASTVYCFRCQSQPQFCTQQTSVEDLLPHFCGFIKETKLTLCLIFFDLNYVQGALPFKGKLDLYCFFP